MAPHSPDEREDADDRGSTMTRMRTLPEVRRAMWWRRAGLAVLAVIVALAAIGVFGVKSRTVTTTGQGYQASLTYAGVARSGWDVPWHLVITHPGGFGDGSVTVAVNRSFFDIYETQGFHPEPDSSTSDGDYIYLEFAAPPGDTLTVDYDTYIQPSAQIGRRNTLWLITGGTRRLSLDWHTVLMP